MTIQPTPELFYGKPLIFDEAKHVYRWNDLVVPGVTTILQRMHKPALIQWAADMAVAHVKSRGIRGDRDDAFTVYEADLAEARLAHRRIKEEAADIGSRVHEYAEAVLRGTPTQPALDEMEDAGRVAFEAWLKEHDVEPRALERRVFSEQHFFAGTTDFYGVIDGELAVLDFKTSSGIWPDYWLQTAAYELALKEELRINEPMARWIIRLDKKTGKFEAARREFSIDQTSAWVQLVALNRTLSRIDAAEKELKPKRAKKAAA